MSKRQASLALDEFTGFDCVAKLPKQRDESHELLHRFFSSLKTELFR